MSPYSIAALRERARLMSQRLGFEGPPVETAHGLTSNGDYVRWLQEEERASEMPARVAAGRPPVYQLWYRESPRPLVPQVLEDRVQENDPPVTDPGMVRLQLDPQGRLVGLDAVPPDLDEAGATGAAGEKFPESVWGSLFREAGLDLGRFTEVEPSRTPPFFADARAAWEGTLAEAEDVTLRVEAAAYRGRPVSFRLIGPWTRDRGAVEPPKLMDVVQPYVFLVLAIALLLGLALLARRNLNSGRSDLRGARRVALFLFIVEEIHMLATGGIFVGGDDIGGRFFTRLALVTFVTVIAFMAYVALEPYVRRLWPTTLISWTRLLAGRLADPRVGRDLLIGAAAGVFTCLLWTAHTRLPGLLGLPDEPLGLGAIEGALGPLAAFARLPDSAGASVGQSMLLLLSLVLLRLLLRKPALAIAVYFLIVTVLGHLASPHPLLDIGIHAVVSAVTLLVVLRVGLLALVSMWFFETAAGRVSTLDPSSWVWGSSIVFLVAMLVLTAYAAVVAAGGRTLLAEDV